MFCIKCGTQIADTANFCVECGAAMSPLRQAANGEVPPPLPAAFASTARPTATSANITGGAYAGFWRRFAAYMVDTLVILAAAVLAMAFFYATGAASEESADAVLQLVTWVGGWLYFAFMHSSAQQASLGKRAFGIKVTNLAGERIGFGRATGRYFASILSGLLLFVGYFMAGFTKRRQALHDMIAGTLVVSRDATPASVDAGLAPPQVSGGVIAVACLASIIPLGGILAAISIPAYQDYLVRSQVSEGLMMASMHKASVAEAVASGTSFADISSESLGLSTDAAGKYVESIRVVQGTVSIIYGGAASDKLTGKSIVLVPGVTENGDVVWICGKATVPAGVVPALEDFADYTDIEAKYLPSACRG